MSLPVVRRFGETSRLRRFPLELISPKNHDSMNSTFGNRPDVDAQTSVATIHPDDAAPRGIRTGDSVRLFRIRGC